MRTPPGTDPRLGLLPDTGKYFVIVAAPPRVPSMNLLALVNQPGPGEIIVLLTHDEGVGWPNRHDVALAEAVLEAGGIVILKFASLNDAMSCHRRLMREMAE
jgi:hypothetical protein